MTVCSHIIGCADDPDGLLGDRDEQLHDERVDDAAGMDKFYICTFSS